MQPAAQAGGGDTFLLAAAELHAKAAALFEATGRRELAAHARRRERDARRRIEERRRAGSVPQAADG